MTAGAPTIATNISGLHHAIAEAERRTPTTDPTRKRARLGFVPTMGFLHEGHATLMRRARSECDVVAASIFVNPTQFGPEEDYETYPRDIERDMAIMTREGVDVVFLPGVADIYPNGTSETIDVGAVAIPLEGASRPGHFQGVATVVHLLLNATHPDRAYFGEKDWQQLQVVRAMVRLKKWPVQIVGVPIVREPDGLAMSSRNVRLSEEERHRALCVAHALDSARSAFRAGETSSVALEEIMREVIAAEPSAKLDYAVVADSQTLLPISTATESSRALIAARVGSVRLIDNCALG